MEVDGNGISVILSASVADAGFLADPTVSMGLGPLAAIYQAQFMEITRIAA